MKKELTVENIPKAELHVHLEGTIKPETYQKLLKKYHETPSVNPYQFRNFKSFIRGFGQVVSVLREPKDYYWLALEFLKKQAELKVLYTEFFLSISSRMHNEGWADQAFRQIKSAIEEVEQKDKIWARVIVDINRASSWDIDGKIAARYAVANRKNYVVGLSLGGNERAKPIEIFTPTFRYARKNGLKCCAHAGETGPVENIKKSIFILGAKRIGHGLKAVDDLEFFKQNCGKSKIAFEICPLAESALRLINQKKENPIRQLYRSGIPIVIGSDDPTFFKTDIENELLYLIRNLGFSIKEIALIMKQSINFSFLTKMEKKKLIDLFKQKTP